MALVPCPGDKLPRISPEVVREAERHVRSCPDCTSKVGKYRQLVNRPSNPERPVMAPPGADCPKDDFEWRKAVAGQLSEWKVKTLIMHAAFCDRCGPLLRAAASENSKASSQKQEIVALWGERATNPLELGWSWFAGRRVMLWLVPATLAVIVVVLGAIRMSSPMPISGPQLAEFAVRAHEQRARGRLSLDFRSESQQALNDWFKNRLPFVLALPASGALPGENWPFRLEGARLVNIQGKTAALIAYEMHMGPVTLMVAPDSVAMASGGVRVDFKKVSFHYSMVEGYKVVTWSVHGLTYALVSQEGSGTQQSCMVCHSAMRDRDLSRTPTPLPLARTPVSPVWQ